MVEFPATTTRTKLCKYTIAGWIVCAIGLFLVLKLHLLGALFAGLLVHQLVHLLAPHLSLSRANQQRGKLVAVTLLSIVVVSVLTTSIVGLIALVRSYADDLGALMEMMGNTLEVYRAALPAWIAASLPTTTEDMTRAIASWFRDHARTFEVLGTDTMRTFARIMIGMIIGALVSLRKAQASNLPLPRALTDRASRITLAFRRVVFAQVRISIINTILASLYLVAALPLMGINLPLAKTLIVITFVAGLLPIIGNLISNTMILLVSLGYSPMVALGSVTFLVLVHKLEYLLNARIIGAEVHAKTWELLAAMLVMEAAFGVTGVIAAPIYYAYLKDELKSYKLI